MGTKTAAKTGAKTFVKMGTKTAAKTGAKSFVKMGTKIAAKTGAKTFVKMGTKTAAKTGAKSFIKMGAKSLVKVANPIGIVSDLAQEGLEVVGYEEAGKKVGIAGNIATGAMIGGGLGGPPGVVVGALAGFGMWGVGEVVGRLVDWSIGE